MFKPKSSLKRFRKYGGIHTINVKEVGLYSQLFPSRGELSHVKECLPYLAS